MYMTLNKVLKQLFYVLLLISSGYRGFAAEAPVYEKDWKSELIEQASEKLAARMALNARNEMLGFAEYNSYLIELNDNASWKNTRNWTDERGKVESKLFSDAELDSFNSRLVGINTKKALVDKSAAIYVVVINDWKLYLRTTLSPLDVITSLTQFNAKEKSMDALRQEMGAVPQAVINEVKTSKSRQQVYLYLFSRISVFDNPDEKTQDVTPKSYIYTSFSESPQRLTLTGVASLKTLGRAGLIHENLQRLERYYTGNSESLQLAYQHSIPAAENALVATALQKPVREISQSPSDRNLSVYDYSNMISTETRLQEMEALCRDLRTGSGEGLYLKVFHTDFRMPAGQISAIREYTGKLAAHDMVIWLHLNSPGQVTSSVYFGPGLKDKLSKDFVDHTCEMIGASLKIYHKFTSMPAQLLAYGAGAVSGILKGAELNRIYWDPSLGAEYDARVFYFYYAQRTYLTKGSGFMVNAIQSDKDDLHTVLWQALKLDMAQSQYEFAFVAGLWGGVTTELAGLSDAVEMLCHAYTDPPSLKAVNDFMDAAFRAKTYVDLYDGVLKGAKDRYSSELQSDYQLLYHGGKDIVAIGTLFIGVGELAGAAKVSQSFAKMAAITNSGTNLLQLSSYLYRGVNGLKIYRMGLQTSRMYVHLAATELGTVIRLVRESGQILSKADIRILREVSMITADGRLVKTTLLINPAEELGSSIRQIRELASDAYKNRLIEVEGTGGRRLVVETSEGNIGKVVDEAGGVAGKLAAYQRVSALADDVPSLRIKLEGLDATTLRLLNDDLADAALLAKFKTAPELLEAWDVLRRADVAEAVRLGRNGELEKVSKYIADSKKTVAQVADDIKGAGGYQKWADDLAKGVVTFANQIDNALLRLTGKAKYVLNNTGEYKIVKGHHPMAKKAFEGDLVYDYNKAFSVKTSALDDAWKTTNSGIPQNLHGKITGQQNSLYSNWKQANPNSKLTIEVMADIEIQAMKNVGIPEDIATGWVVKSLEDLKAQGVTAIKNIPWNGVN
jgi:hypothetical protein